MLPSEAEKRKKLFTDLNSHLYTGKPKLDEIISKHKDSGLVFALSPIQNILGLHPVRKLKILKNQGYFFLSLKKGIKTYIELRNSLMKRKRPRRNVKRGQPIKKAARRLR